MGSNELESLDRFRLGSATELTKTETFASRTQVEIVQSNSIELQLFN